MHPLSFESCLILQNISLNLCRNDFASICRRYGLNYKQVMDEIGTNGEGRYTLDAFIHFMKRPQHHPHYNYDSEYTSRPMSPPHRPPSGGKTQHVSRQGVHSLAGSHHHRRHNTRYPMSPTTGPPTGGIPFNDQDNDFTPAELDAKRRQEMRTPDVSYSYTHTRCSVVYAYGP